MLIFANYLIIFYINMKRVVVILSLIVASAFSAYAQDLYNRILKQKYYIANRFQEVENEYVFTDTGIAVQKVITGKGDKDILYNKIREFLVITYKDSKEVIQVDDKEAGLIIGKGLDSFYIEDMEDFGSKLLNKIYHIIKAECKDDRVRLTISIDYIDEYRPAWKGNSLSRPSPATTTRVFIPDLYKRYLKDMSIDEDKYVIDNELFNREYDIYAGYQVYHCIEYILRLQDDIKLYINKNSTLYADDNW